MKRIFQLAALFIGALLLVPFLPLYIERTMTRSQMESGGDIVSWGWKLRTLYSFWSDYNYFRPEENFFFWLVLNLALACLYALVITLGTAWLLAYRKRRVGKDYGKQIEN